MSERETKAAEVMERLDRLIEAVAWKKFCRAQAAAAAHFPRSMEVTERTDQLQALLAQAGPDKAYVEQGAEKEYQQLRARDEVLSQMDRNAQTVARMVG